MSKTINISLSTSSINCAIAELEAYKRWNERKTAQLNERLATLGAMYASKLFGSAAYDGNNDVQVTAEPTENGWRIIASGKAVLFIEFGAGVYYNGAEPYPEPRPAGVEKIGEYGKGKGKHSLWAFLDENGELVKTHGTPAAMPMFYTTQELISEIGRVAQEVFSYD